ncbi:TIGR04282 family arsenosugar biosynthesis glycosyltransferase [Actinomadura yumaensis]|uniref:TIGR04282 family arsenosugar biosynthesis glycosyltransferase n=1 Tax=Actinomadura yumaensis TaxID=111807 RepID=A0ABW2CRY7_9ACTN
MTPANTPDTPAGTGAGRGGGGGDLCDLIVIAKEPVPGRVKTRLTPPYTPEQAALLAEAALTDTLDTAVAARTVRRRTLALAGRPGPWLPPGFAVVPQRGDGLDERIAAAFDDAHRAAEHAAGPRPLVLIGMDTPQLTPALLDGAARALTGSDAVIGPASDGGFWLLGLRRPDAALLRGVPMSRPDTGHLQLGRLRAAGLTVAILPELTDVDTAEDAAAVAASAPDGRFAFALRALHTTPRASRRAVAAVAPPGGRGGALREATA